MLLAFAYSTLSSYISSFVVVFGVAVVIEHALFVLKFALAYLIPDVPSYIRQKYAMSNFIKEQLLKRVKDKTDIRFNQNKFDETKEEERKLHSRMKNKAS